MTNILENSEDLLYNFCIEIAENLSVAKNIKLCMHYLMIHHGPMSDEVKTILQDELNQSPELRKTITMKALTYETILQDIIEERKVYRDSYQCKIHAVKIQLSDLVLSDLQENNIREKEL